MWKPVAAGLMCLGIVTLGVAISHGQDEEELIVIDGNVIATELKAKIARETTPAAVVAPAAGELAEIVIGDDNGINIEREPVTAAPTPAGARFTRLAAGLQEIDPQTRETLDKMVAGLKEQIQKLESEGKKDEAQQKTQSLRVIEFILHGNPRVRGINIIRRQPDPKLTMDEIRKLHARRAELIEQSSKLPEGARSDREKLEREFDKVNQEIAEKHQSLTAPQPVVAPQGINIMGGQPGKWFPFIAAVPPGTPQFNADVSFTAGRPLESAPPAAMALLRKSEALSQAAAQLKTNGLDEQAQPLLAQAEKLKAEAQKLMQEEAQKHHAHGGRGMGGGMMGGPPGLELHRSIRELQEQIQQLRKEVAELRELLQRKQ